MIQYPPIPEQELERLLSLSELELDYQALQDSLQDLTLLAARIAGTEISLINLIDSYTQWSVARQGIDLQQMPREESVCQYTIMQEGSFEVKDLSADDRFKQRSYVAGEPNLTYYFGIPLTTEEGQNIGALCVLDKTARTVDAEKEALLKIIANEIVNRLKAQKVFESMRRKLDEALEAQNKLAHDIRGPIGGMIGLAQLCRNQNSGLPGTDMSEVFGMIEDGGKSIMVMAEDILGNASNLGNRKHLLRHSQFNLTSLKETLEKLYQPMATTKGLRFNVQITNGNLQEPFNKARLLQICGNLVSNAIKFTPVAGMVQVELSLLPDETENRLSIRVRDSGVGIDETAIREIMQGAGKTNKGTSGEKGYGFGLLMVKGLVEELSGLMHIHSAPQQGTGFEISIPQARTMPRVKLPDFRKIEHAN